jgi:conjugative transfer region protein TrbK
MSDMNAIAAMVLRTTLCLGVLAVAACTVHLSDNDDQPLASQSTAKNSDSAAAELEGCRMIEYEQKDRPAECRNIWVDKRRQFFWADKDSETARGRRDPKSAPSASDIHGHLPSTFFPAPAQSE